MTRVIALARIPRNRLWFEAARAALVCGCAIALIAAERALPNLSL